MADLGPLTVVIDGETGELENNLESIECSAARIQTRIEKALKDAQVLRTVLQQCDALQTETQRKT